MSLNLFTYSFVALFLVINPIGNIPIFVALLEEFDVADRKSMIKKAVLIATITLIIFTALGNYIFRFLGIEIYSFKIAGGVLLFVISMEMLFGRRTRTEYTAEQLEERKKDIEITPMAIPLLTGPGAITTGIVLFNSAKTIADQFLILFDIVLVFLVSYLILIQSNLLFRVLGSTGTRVIVRVMGLLLSAIAIKFIISGITEAFKNTF